jgi:predicted PurR-regulated permease PerM
VQDRLARKHNAFIRGCHSDDLSRRGIDLSSNRSRVGWWVFVGGLGLLAAYLIYSFVGMAVLGVFGYYATRPIYRRVARVIDADGIAAGATVLLIVVPLLALVFYTGFHIVQQLQQALGSSVPALLATYIDLGSLPAEQRRMVTSLLQNPSQLVSNPQQVFGTALSLGSRVLGAVAGGIVLLGLALALSFFLLRSDDRLSAGLIELFGGRDTTAYAYAVAVDEDLESVFFGNLQFVAVMSVIAAVAYEATNLLAPQGLQMPIVLVLAVLTGFASLIPLVVGKIIYLPVVAYLAAQAIRTGGGALLFVAGVLVVYFLVLDILPQTFIQPYVTGKQLDMLVLMFGYVLGPILWGWYGFFLLPVVFIVMLEAIRIVLPQLIHGETLTGDIALGEDIGVNPQAAREGLDEDEPST